MMMPGVLAMSWRLCATTCSAGPRRKMRGQLNRLRRPVAFGHHRQVRVGAATGDVSSAFWLVTHRMRRVSNREPGAMYASTPMIVA